MNNMLKAGDEDFKKVIEAQETPFMVEFFATWCGHCQRMEPVLEEVAKEYNGKIKIIQVDVDKASKTTTEFNVTGTPTMVFYKNGQPVDTFVGERSKEELKEKFDSLI